MYASVNYWLNPMFPSLWLVPTEYIFEQLYWKKNSWKISTAGIFPNYTHEEEWTLPWRSFPWVQHNAFSIVLSILGCILSYFYLNLCWILPLRCFKIPVKCNVSFLFQATFPQKKKKNIRNSVENSRIRKEILCWRHPKISFFSLFGRIRKDLKLF